MRHDQEEITIGDNTFTADKKFIPLLRELHKLGLKTIEHCQGNDWEDGCLVGEHLHYSFLLLELQKGSQVITTPIDGKTHILISWIKEKP